MEAGRAFLMYHELELPGRSLCQSDPGYTRYIVAASAFESQIRHLKSLDYEGLSVGRALEFSGGKSVAITFDDGCETDLVVAAPALTELGFGATFYVTTGFLGRPGFMSESQLCELNSAGFEVGCHSMTHQYLSDLDAAGLQREVVDAKTRLEQIIGRRVDHFSCPGGRFDDRVVEAAKRAGYQTLATSLPRLNSVTTDRYALGRIPVLRHTSNEELARMCEGSGSWKLSLGQTFRATAKRMLGNRLYDRVRAILLLGPSSK
jgi:peptidoglycan/xylan/chitin deacetylase (PgdA/CDA1 family)